MVDSSKHRRVNMGDLLVKSIEEIFVTSVNKETKTFFSQCTKFPNEDLINLNLSVNEYCQQVIAKRKSNDPDYKRPTSVSAGEVYFCRYDLDNCWYRAQAMSRDKVNKRCKVLFVDYGNVSSLSYSDLIEADPKETPLLEHCPFGAPCYPKEFDCFTSEQQDTLLDLLLEKYATVVFVEKQSRIQWLVELPRYGNNSFFWKPFANYTKRLIEQNQIALDKALAKEEQQTDPEDEIKRLRAVAEKSAAGEW